MAKEKKNKDNDLPKSEILAVYFKSLTLDSVKCFKYENTIELSDGVNKPAMWTVILGNNNTGKTTILKCLAGLEAKKISMQNPDSQTVLYAPLIFFDKDKKDKIFFKQSKPSSTISSSLYSSKHEGTFSTYRSDWRYTNGSASTNDSDLNQLQIYSYGATRKISETSISEFRDTDENRLDNLFYQKELPNIEEWLLQLFLSEKLGQTKATNIIAQVKNVLTSGLLPDVNGLDIKSIESGNSFENFIEFNTDYGKVRLKDLGYGYQSMMGWVLDLVRRMVERYPSVEKPLEQPAIVLVDEIDLHLHPEWQRKIIAHLTKYFPKTQFIVTAHSPLIVQSAERVNVVLLKKEGDHVTIEQPTIKNFRGWTVDEILEDLMQLGDHVMSDTYLNLVHDFDAALDADDVEKAEKVYNLLSKILHPQSNRRKLMEIQMTSLSPA